MDQENSTHEPVRHLTRTQRRVLGVLVEKAYTTPEYYPLTLKALTAGCNQKSNRAPLTQHSEDTVLDALEELREMGLVAELHTDGGRAPRYRHYMRKRFEFTEPQLAILTELLLRGRQQLGELRSRASRMVKIDGLPELREALAGLLEQGAVQASGPLERRGIDVDHNFYMPGETKPLAASAAPAEPPPAARQAAPTEPAPVSAPVAAQDDATAIALRQLLEQVAELTAAQEDLRNRVTDLSDRFDRLAREAGLQT